MLVHAQKVKKVKLRITIQFSALPLNYRQAKDEFAQQYLSAALKKFDHNISHTAKALSISRRALQLHIAKHGLGQNLPQTKRSSAPSTNFVISPNED